MSTGLNRLAVIALLRDVYAADEIVAGRLTLALDRLWSVGLAYAP